jgi:hypothetical protein
MKLVQWLKDWLRVATPHAAELPEVQLPNPFFATLGS